MSYLFPKDFMWGAASAAHQIEGAALEDGKTAGIWDALCEGHVAHGESGAVACDHYHRYQEDVALMKRVGIKTYRFSVSWPRVIPAPGQINEQGLQFYKNLVNELVEAGIEPMCTVFHWNLPMWLHEMGGWECEQAPEYFAQYTKVLVDALSDKVKYWFTINEPQCFIGVGYGAGAHAPFLKKGHEEMKKITRIVLLAHGRGVETIRKYAKQPVQIGMAPTGSCTVPIEETAEAIEAARQHMFSPMGGNCTWADPAVLGVVPKLLEDVLTEADMKVIHQPLDFFAFNIYNSTNYEEGGKTYSTVTPGLPRTAMNWVVTPEVMYWASKFHHERYGLPILISENGMANLDWVMEDGKVHDPQRIDYIRRYLKQLHRALAEGVPVIGYLYWSIMDNYEWNEGYDKRFGLIYIDYLTQKRTLKDSAYAYQKIIATNGGALNEIV